MDRILILKSPRRTISWLAVFLVLLSIVQTLPGQLDYLRTQWDILGLWPDAAAQSRRQLGTELYDMLKAADAVLPDRAAVLLVTPGADPRRSEYVAFHRALYHLAPRPIWWVNPARPDGTWESRWWIQAPITSEELTTVAKDRKTEFIVFYQVVPPPNLGAPVALTPNAHVVALDGEPLASPVAKQVAGSNESWRLAGLVVGFLAIFAAGYAVVGATSRFGYVTGWIESAALAWALGAGLVSLAMLWLNALGVSLDAQLIVVTAVAVMANLLMISLRRTRPAFSTNYSSSEEGNSATVRRGDQGTRSRFAQFLMAILIAIELAYVALLAVGRPLSIWDSWVTWAMKARIILLDGHISAGVFADPSRLVTHLDYPLLLPLLEAWTFAWAGTSADWLAGIQAVLFFASLLGVSYGVVRRLGAGRTLASAVAVWIGSMANIAGLATLVFADLPLAVYSTIAAAYVPVWLKTKSPGSLMLALVAGGFMPWTKREGVAILAALGIAILVINHGNRAAWLAAGALAFASLLLSGPWWAFVAGRGIANTDFLPVSIETLEANYGRLPAIARIELTSLLSANWNYVWPATLLFGLLVVRTPRQTVDLLPVTALLYLGLMSMGYIFSAFVPYQQHVASSMDRLIAHVVPLPVLWIAYRSIEER